MLGDLWEYLIDFFNMTIKPALRNLFSSKKFFISMLLAIFVLQALLCVICIAGINNVVEQNDILEACAIYIAANTGEYTGDAELLQQVEVISGSAGIFAGALCIWWLCAMTIYYRMAAASAERNKYVWGLYITYGSYKKKIRRMLLTELYLTLAAGMALGFPTAYLICRFWAGKEDLISLDGAFGLALLIAVISIRICAEIEVRLITSKSCNTLLGAEGAAGNIVSPRRSGKLSKGYSAPRYAATAFWRLRRYYIAVALAAAVPVVVWVCCMTASISETQILQEDIDEFAIKSSVGFDPEILQNEFIEELEEIPGVSSVWSLASGNATSLGTHALLTSAQTASVGSCATLAAVYADGDAYIADAYDPVFLLHTGFEGHPNSGEVVIIMPTDDQPYNFDDVTLDGATDIYLMIAISKTDGKIQIIDDINDDIEHKLTDSSNEYEYMRFRVVGGFNSYRNGYLEESGDYIYTDRPYFLLSTEDYEKITSIKMSSLRETIENGKITIDTSQYTDGSFLITVKGGLETLPSAGDAISLDKTASARLTAYADGEYLSYDEQFNAITEYEKTVNATTTFSQLYIIDAYQQDGDTVLHVSPRTSILLHRFVSYPVFITNRLQLGTMEIEGDNDYGLNDAITYVASTYDKPFSVTYHSVNISGILTVCRPTAYRAADLGTYILFEDGRIKDPSDKYRLSDVYATNNFTLVCSDSITPDVLGIDATSPENDEAVLLLPTSGSQLFTLTKGDSLKIARAKDVTITDSMLNLDPLYRLTKQLETENYEYEELFVCEIKAYEGIITPMILVSSNTYSKIVGKELPYNTINVMIDSDLKLSHYNKLKNELILWMQLTEDEEGEMTLTTTNNYFDILLRRAADYSIWLKIIATLVPFLIIPAWYYPQTMMFTRRREDYLTLFHIGKTHRDIRKIFALESLMAAGLAILGLAVDYFALPMEFRIAAFDFGALAIGCVVGAIGAAGTVWLGYLTARKEIKKNGNS